MTTSKDELLPCPFPRCQTKNGPRLEIDTEEWEIARVVCRDCGAAGPFVDLSDYGGDEVEAGTKAVALWNTRQSAQPEAPLMVGDAPHRLVGIWQASRGEWFGPDVVSIVEDFAEWLAALTNKETGR